MLICAINVSEGRRIDAIETIAKSAQGALLDVHHDADHNRSVFTLAGDDVLDAAICLTQSAASMLDLGEHVGVHPRLGIVDVVPFAPFGIQGLRDDPDLGEALLARQSFAEFAARELNLPTFFYGPERSLPEVRRQAFRTLAPDCGPTHAHPRLGATCVGARPGLIAYNLWLKACDLTRARAIASLVRGPDVRCLALTVGDALQISCNLIAPWRVGPAEIFDAVRAHCSIERPELVGLIARDILRSIPQTRWRELDVAEERTFEHRFATGFAKA